MTQVKKKSAHTHFTFAFNIVCRTHLQFSRHKKACMLYAQLHTHTHRIGFFVCFSGLDLLSLNFYMQLRFQSYILHSTPQACNRQPLQIDTRH